MAEKRIRLTVVLIGVLFAWAGGEAMQNAARGGAASAYGDGANRRNELNRPNRPNRPNAREVPNVASTPNASNAQGGPIYQLRIYEIFEHNKAAFHARFRDRAIPIMRKYDFKIRSMWESRFGGRTEFVYLLEWPSEEVMKDRWAKFMADEEWARIKRETAQQHGALVGEIQDRTLTTLDYSPILPERPMP